MTGKPSAPRSDGGDRRQGSSKTTAPERMESNRALSSPADFPSYLQDCAPPAKRGTKRRVELFSDARKRPRTSPHLSPVEEAGDKLASNKHPTNPIDFGRDEGTGRKNILKSTTSNLTALSPTTAWPMHWLAKSPSRFFPSVHRIPPFLNRHPATRNRGLRRVYPTRIHVMRRFSRPKAPFWSGTAKVSPM